jgi:hypothetical protein
MYTNTCSHALRQKSTARLPREETPAVHTVPIGVFFKIPNSAPTPLEVAPRLASWMARDHPDQRRLALFLDHAEALVADAIATISGPLALRLDVGLPSSVDLLQHHDLDNYLFPLVGRLGPHRFASVWATKRHADVSLIRVDRPALGSSVDPAWLHRVVTTRSAESVAWKEEVRSQLLGAEPVRKGPVDLELSYRVGPARNWANLWKQTIDALDPLLGSTGRRWNPRDGRVVRLGLHQQLDQSIGHAVEIDVVAAPAGTLDQ